MGRVMNPIRLYTGTAHQEGKFWWALCNEVPVAAQGVSYNQAVRSLMEAVASYSELADGPSGEKAEPPYRFQVTVWVS